MASTTAPPLPAYAAGTPVSVEEYERIALVDPGGRWELDEGRLREKPGMTWDHVDVISHLSFLLRSHPNRSAFRVHTDIARLRRPVATGNYSMPDLVVIPLEMGRDLRGRRDRLEVFVDPLPLVVEARSPSTGDYDMTSKLPEYRRRGDAEIWRLHPNDRALTAWRRRPDGSYAETLFTGGQVRPVALPNVTIDLATLFDPSRTRPVARRRRGAPRRGPPRRPRCRPTTGRPRPGDAMPFCQSCGAPTEERDADGRSRPVCTACGTVTFLDPKLAAAVLVERAGRVLLGRRGEGARAAGGWSFPAGFVERGEPVEAAAAREAREETGLDVVVGPLLGLYSAPGETVVLAVYLAHAAGGEPTAGDDLDAVGWFAPDALPPLAFPHDRRILDDWRGRKIGEAPPDRGR